MTDIIECAEAALKTDCLDSSLAVFVPPLIAELKAERVMRAETQRQLRQFIADFCALRDALPREQVEKILSRETA
jgi:hypothetical protein